MRISLCLAFACLAALITGGSALALESRLPYAASLPEPDEQSARALAYIEASRTGSTLLQRIESESFALELTDRETKIANLSGASDRVLSDFQRLLVTEGFDAFNILSAGSTPRFKTRLKHSVCVVLQTKKKQAKTPKPILITSDLSDVKTTAAAFGLAKLFEDFRIEAQTPLWICARSDNPASSGELAGKAHFASNILLSGASPNAFINYLGQVSTRLLFRERAWEWIRDDSNRAQKVADQVIERLSNTKSRWDTDKTSPWSQTQLTAVQCKKSFISSVRNTCWFDVTVTSRSQVVLSERTEELLNLALNETRKANKSLGSPKGRPAVTLSLPKNSHIKPVAGDPEKLRALIAWRASLTQTPNRAGYLSGRFIRPHVVGDKAQAIPLLTLSAYGKEKKETTSLLTILAKTLLLLADSQLQ